MQKSGGFVVEGSDVRAAFGVGVSSEEDEEGGVRGRLFAMGGGSCAKQVCAEATVRRTCGV